jgi:hypothetical protein
MIPAKPFDSYKWRWLSFAPTESLLAPPVFLGVLRVLARHENQAPSDDALIAELAQVQAETHTPVNLARNGDRNLIRNSGQYWKGTGLLTPERGQIHLTALGKRVAEGLITQGEFAAIMVQQTVLPNPWTYKPEEIAKWRAANLEIRPLKLILEIIEELGRRHGGLTSAYLTNNELMRVVIPLAGAKQTPAEIARNVALFRSGGLDITEWPNCTPSENDPRLAREFLLFLSNFGLLRLAAEGLRDEQRFYLNELFDVDAVTAPVVASIFGDVQSAAQAVEQIRHSDLPSIIERQRAITSTIARPKQAKFRREILKAYSNQCFLTGDNVTEVLEAAHIIPVTSGGDDDRANGLCLRVDVHRLFDSGNIRIRPSGEVVFSEAVSESRTYSQLPNRIELPAFVNPVNVEWRNKYC